MLLRCRLVTRTLTEGARYFSAVSATSTSTLQASPIARSKTMKIQILSDLHLEFLKPGEFQLPPPIATCLALLGDLGCPTSAPYREMLANAAARWQHVFVVAGNHEFYGTSVPEGRRAIASACAAAGPNVTFMNRTAVDVEPGVRVVGVTLWTHVPGRDHWQIQSCVSDYQAIGAGDDGRRWSVSHMNRLHEGDVQWLTAEIQKLKKENEEASQEGRTPTKLVVLSHHAPHMHGTSHPMHEGSNIQCAFATDLEHLLRPPVTLWAFGHTHYSCNIPLCEGSVRLVSNQRGYPQELADAETGFDPNFVVEV